MLFSTQPQLFFLNLSKKIGSDFDKNNHSIKTIKIIGAKYIKQSINSKNSKLESDFSSKKDIHLKLHRIDVIK